MNRKANTLIFILLASLFNIAAGIVSFVILFLIYARFVSPRLDGAARPWGLPLILLASFGISFLAYHGALRIFMKKAGMKKNFSPLFAPEGAEKREEKE